MKKVLYLLVALLGFAACNNDTPTPPSPEEAVLTLTSESSIWFEAEGGEGAISYTLENPVKGVSLTAKASVEWIEVSRIEQTIIFTVDANDTEVDRRGKITVEYGNKSFSVSIMQHGMINADVTFKVKSLDGSSYLGKVENMESYNYYLMLSDKGLSQSGYLYDNASYYLFDLYAAVSAADGVATIPTGEYTLGYDKSAGVINAGYSKLITTTTNNSTSTLFSDIRLIVSENKIEAYITLDDGKKHHITYEGSLEIEPYKEDVEGISTLRRDYYFDINDGLFVGAYLGNYYHSSYDTCSVYLFEHLDLETGEEEGDEFQLDLQLPRGGTDICGTYTPGTSAGHFLIGYMEDMGGGQYMQTNSFYMTAGYADFAPLVDGTIKVERDENEVYTFTINCVDDKGYKISGRFRGTGKFTEW